MRFIIIWILVGVNIITSIVKTQSIIEADHGEIEQLDVAETLECHRKRYSFHVTQTDENGKKCEGTLYDVMACWGRCDSNEVK